MADRTEILDRLFVNAEVFMHELVAQHGAFSNQEMLRKLAHDQQRAYIDLLYSFRDTEGREPFDAAHQEIGKRLASIAARLGYAHAPEDDEAAFTIFDTGTTKKFYRRKSD